MSSLRYWAVLFTQDDQEGSCAVAVTDGERTPHDEETVRKVIEVKYGKVRAMSAVGPMITSELAHDYVYSATATPAGLNAWLNLAESVSAPRRLAQEAGIKAGQHWSY